MVVWFFAFFSIFFNFLHDFLLLASFVVKLVSDASFAHNYAKIGFTPYHTMKTGLFASGCGLVSDFAFAATYRIRWIASCSLPLLPVLEGVVREEAALARILEPRDEARIHKPGAASSNEAEPAALYFPLQRRPLMRPRPR